MPSWKDIPKCWIPARPSLLGCRSLVAWRRSSRRQSRSRRVPFHDDGRRQRQRREEESFHEWHVVVSPDTDEVCNSNGFEASPKECDSKWSAAGALTGGCGQGFSVGEVCWLEAELVGEVSEWTGWRGTLADCVVGAGHR